MWRRAVVLIASAGLVCAGGCGGGGGIGKTDVEIGVGDLVMPGSNTAGVGQVEGFIFVPTRSRQEDSCVLTISVEPLPGQEPAAGVTVLVEPEGFTDRTNDQGYFRISGVTVGPHIVRAQGIVEVNGEQRACVGEATLEATVSPIPEGFGHASVSTDQPGWDLLKVKRVQTLIADVVNPGPRTAAAWAVAGRRSDATRATIEGFRESHFPHFVVLPPPGQASRQAPEDLYFLTGVKVAPQHAETDVEFDLPNQQQLKQDLNALVNGEINELHFYGIAQTEDGNTGRQEDDDAVIVLSNIRLKVTVSIDF